jgi:hypothetical protein
MATQMAAQALTDSTHFDTSLWETLEKNVAQRPDHRALTALYEPADHLNLLLSPTIRHVGTSKTFAWTYAQLTAAAEPVARHFVHLGL